MSRQLKGNVCVGFSKCLNLQSSRRTSYSRMRYAQEHIFFSSSIPIPAQSEKFDVGD